MEECVRVFEVDPDAATLLDLHDLIQAAVEFDSDHLFEFYIGRRPRDRRIVLGCEDDFLVWDDFVEPYLDTTVADVFPLPEKCKLYYLFDFGDEWLFTIRKSRKKPREPEPGVTYPRLIDRIGPSPAQYGDWEEDWEEDWEDEGDV